MMAQETNETDRKAKYAVNAKIWKYSSSASEPSNDIYQSFRIVHSGVDLSYQRGVITGVAMLASINGQCSVVSVLDGPNCVSN